MEEREMKEDPIRVLQVFGSLERGGAECRMMDVWRNIDRNHVHFDFLILKEGEQALEPEVRSLGSKVFKLGMPHLGRIGRHYRQLRAAIRAGNYDVIHVHTSYYSGLVLAAARQEGVPVRIAHARTSGSQRVSLAKVPMVVAGRALIDACATDRLAVSDQAGSYLFGSREFKILPNAIDVERYQHTNQDEILSIREAMGLPSGAFAAVQIGRFEAVKNHKFTLQLIEAYAKLHSDVYLVLVGGGKLRTETEEYASSLGLGERVRFVGVRDDVPSIMRAFDVLLLPSYYEGLPGVVLESQAAGVPVVASEAVPQEADMGLGLIKKLSLDSDTEAWIAALDEVRGLRSYNYPAIREAFAEHGFSLQSEIQALMGIYERSRL